MIASDRIKKLDEFFKAFSIISEGNYVYLCDIKEDYSRWSKSAVDYFNLPDVYMYGAGSVWEDHIHPDDREKYHESIERIFSGADEGHEMQYRAMANDGCYVDCTCRGVVLRDNNGNPEYFAGAIKNHGSMSYIDTITGLRNLYGFFDDVKAVSKNKERNEYAVLMLGITSFSNINDVHGYTFGNSVLRKFSRMIQKSFPDKEVYRMDGTKFCIIVDDMTQEQITDLYDKLHTKAYNEFHVDCQRVPLAINAGLIAVDDFDISAETIFSCLKYAYSESKNHCLGALNVFENKLSNDNTNIFEKINTIRTSVMHGCKGFYLCYQPIMYADTEKIKGVEALIRWKNDKYGIVPPLQFIPVLEQDSLFPMLGRWILRQAMNDCKFFLEQYPDFLISVNISYTQLERSDFVSDIFAILDETGFPANNLCLEITERCRLLDMKMLKHKFAMLKERGIKLALDDFGTGFSSIGVLRELPIDVVKIDREFVKNIENSPVDRKTIMFVSSLSEAFSTEICVEGVENIEMRDLLRKYKVSTFQGYFYSKPVSVEEIAKLEQLDKCVL